MNSSIPPPVPLPDGTLLDPNIPTDVRSSPEASEDRRAIAVTNDWDRKQTISNPVTKQVPRLVRVLSMMITAALITAFGVLAVHHVSSSSMPLTNAENPVSTKPRTQTPNPEETDAEGSVEKDAGSDADSDDADDAAAADDGKWRGLRAAGIPVPGEWSSVLRARPVRTDEEGALYEDDELTTISDPYGPIDATLTFLDALLDPSEEGAKWAKKVLSLKGRDGGGHSYELPNAPQWWYAQRRFDKDSTCTGMWDDNYTNNGYECSGKRSLETDTQIIRSNAYFHGANFPIPDGIEVPSGFDPRDVAAGAYDTVLVPMDDGNWHVTVYCPASLDVRFVDGKANEVKGTDVRPGVEDVYSVVSSTTGFGTRQRPCRVVHLALGGDMPYWAVGGGSS